MSWTKRCVAALAVTATLVLVGAAAQLGHHWLNVSAGLRDITTRCLFITAIGIPLAMFVGLGRSVA